MPNGTQRNASYFLVYAGLIAGLFLTHAAPAAGLNDSGQTLCYNGSAALVACDAANSGDAAPYPGQDGRYGRDAAATAGALTKIGGGAAGFDFTKIANDGTELPASATLGTGATAWACTRDNTTGLTWEVKTDDNGLRDKDWTYTWYSTDGTTNGGDAGQQQWVPLPPAAVPWPVATPRIIPPPSMPRLACAASPTGACPASGNSRPSFITAPRIPLSIRPISPIR